MKVWTVPRVDSEGYAIAPVFILKKMEFMPEQRVIDPKHAEAEIRRYELAVEKVQQDLMELSARDDIFFAHSVLAGDMALHDGVAEKICHSLMNAESALLTVGEGYVQMFEAMEKEYMRERATDLKDVMYRILMALQGREETMVEAPEEAYILAARDLTPSDTAKLNLEHVAGIVMEEGGITSHVSIIARNYGIPCLVGAGELLSDLQQGLIGIVDAQQGTFYLEPSEELFNEYQEKLSLWQQNRNVLQEVNVLPITMPDGREVQVCANVGNLSDIKKAMQYGTDGIGLLRTELIYMENNHFPTEEEQFALYRQALQLLEERELTIRTLDIGGDKQLPYLDMPIEQNPYLGCRAIRWSLTRKDVFKMQLRALLRASAFGAVRIMYPMLVSIEELREANALLKVCQEELRAEGIAFDEAIQIGIMIETPAAVWLAEDFAGQVDFFSIGTNDLTQYMLAVDRGNPRVSSYYNTFHPAVLRAVDHVIQTAHRHGITVSVCGEFAGEEVAIPLLAAMGVDELSVAAARVAAVKHQLAACAEGVQQINLQELLSQSTAEDVRMLLTQDLKQKEDETEEK